MIVGYLGPEGNIGVLFRFFWQGRFWGLEHIRTRFLKTK